MLRLDVLAVTSLERPFCLFSKICNPTIPCGRVHRLLFQSELCELGWRKYNKVYIVLLINLSVSTIIAILEHRRPI